jgi:hypothetical protein
MSSYNVPKALDSFVKNIGDNASWRRSAYTDEKYVVTVNGQEIDIFYNDIDGSYLLQYYIVPSSSLIDEIHSCMTDSKD